MLNYNLELSFNIYQLYAPGLFFFPLMHLLLNYLFLYIEEFITFLKECKLLNS